MLYFGSIHSKRVKMKTIIVLPASLQVTRTEISRANKGEALSYLAQVQYHTGHKMPSTKTGMKQIHAIMREVNGLS